MAPGGTSRAGPCITWPRPPLCSIRSSVEVETAELRDGAVAAVDSRFGHDLASAASMDAALRRILDEHLALRVDMPA